MKFLDKLLDRWRAKEEKKIEVVPKAAPRVLSVRERLDLGLRVKRVNLPRGLPFGSMLLRRRGGFHVVRSGYAPYSGLCPTVRAAFNKALRNLGL
jgi:hypothetical protein